MFEEIQNESFAEREERILALWKRNQTFLKSLHIRENAPHFSFYDGPPFATGLPHYGHLLAGTIKDVVPRYKTMKGFYVSRRFGWDCHGLPVENEIEKNFNLSGAPSIEEFGIAKFNEECRKIVLRYTEEWRSKVERFGRWVDFSKTWKTMDPSFMESVWWVFKQVYEKGLVYEGFKVMPFSAKLGTPLSNFEATENYQEVDDPSIVVALPLVEDPTTSLLIWTTTPWTLISNMAATVGENITYVKIESEGKRYILANEALKSWFKEESDYKVLDSFLGKELVAKRYIPVFSYFKHLGEQGAFQVIADDFVSTEDGTGIVHTAPAFGEVDFFACQKAHIPLVCPVDNNGRFTKDIPEYSGLFVKDADKAIIQSIKENERLFYRGTIRHRYPFCWRSDTPLIYKAITTWFLNVEQIKERLIKANEQVHWTPDHLKEGRFGKWLEGARDWAISRNRYWGTPIPLWRSEEGDIHVVGSVAELEELTGEKVPDLHRHFIDHLTFKKDGKLYKRVPEVFDCWFDAGSMPYAQNHYPFENKQSTEKNFPADFIAEGVDQTRGWFYTLMVLAVSLFDGPAYKNVIANGILLAEDGNKMSKRLKNYPDPDGVVNKCGADAVRLYMLHSPAVKADDLRFTEKGVELVLRQILIPFWNAYSFFMTYARIYNWRPSGKREAPKAMIDQWIISQLNRLIHEVEQGMDCYDLSRAVEPFVGFIDQLTNWYIRRSRRRFWADQDSPDRREAFETLHHTLLELCKIAAPFIPFLSEAIYQNIRLDELPESVHLCDFPLYHPESRQPALEKGMDSLQVAVSLGHSLRKEHKMKVRQPLSAVHVVCEDVEVMEFLKHQEHLIAEELNVKKAIFYKESHEFVKLSIKPNFRVLGKKVGKHMKEAQILINSLPQDQINQMLEKKGLLIELGGEAFHLTAEDVEITRQVHEGWVAMNAGVITIALDTELTEGLILEGIARELVNKINTMRREANFAVTDRIHIQLGATELVKKALIIHGDYVKEEVLALEMQYAQSPHSTNWDINGEPTAIFIKKAK
ncbi:MAG: Isoleucine--tRNA ligase [Chlamydiales bacterium]|nr:Isoleucine--tRNA ligase [Chlamydiales bacterium]